MAMGTRMFSRMNYQVIRGMKEIYSVQELSRDNWTTIKDFFSHRCAYCHKPDTGNPRDGLVPDHLVPASDNGDYVIGNVVAACHGCNDKRGKKHWETWLKSEFPADADLRIHTIKQYLETFPYFKPKNPETRLTEEEWKEYDAILKEWDQLWNRARDLRDRVKERISSAQSK